jgi:hypothetical protein
VTEWRRQWSEDADVLALQQFGDEAQRKVGVAAADAVRGRNTAALCDGFGGDFLRKPNAAEQLAQVDPGGPADCRIGQRNSVRALKGRCERVCSRDIQRRDPVACRHANWRAHHRDAASRYHRAALCQCIYRRFGEDQHVGNLAGGKARLQGPHRLEHKACDLALVVGECLSERRDGDLHRARAEYLHGDPSSSAWGGEQCYFARDAKPSPAAASRAKSGEAR